MARTEPTPEQVGDKARPAMTLDEALAPSPSLLCKIGSLIVHAEEASDPSKGHPFDEHAVKSILSDPEVAAWLEAMDDGGLLPVKR